MIPDPNYLASQLLGIAADLEAGIITRGSPATTLLEAAKALVVLQGMLRGSQRLIERYAVCPDHRDKGTGDRCIVCKFEESARREARRLQTVRKEQQ